VREVTIPEAITISDLANRMSERAVDVIRLLMKQGQMVTINDVIDADTAQLLAEEMGHSVRRVAEADVEEGLFDVADDPAALTPRAPVVTVMGMSTTARPRCSTPSVRATWWRAKPAASPAYRRLSGDRAVRRQGDLHRHARPRRLHRDARARRQGHRYRRAGGGRR